MSSSSSEKFVSSGVLAMTTGDVGKLVEALLALAFSVKHNKEKCKALANKVELIHVSIRHIEEQKEIGRFNEAEYGSSLAKFQQVVEDAMDLVRRYKNKSIWTKRLLLALRLEDDFDSIDGRLDVCTRLFGFNMQVRNTSCISDVKDMQVHNTAAIKDDVRAMKDEVKDDMQEVKDKIQELKRLLKGEVQAEEEPPVGGITLGEEVFGGYIIAAKMQQINGVLGDVMLIASAQLQNKEVAIMKRLSSNANILQFFGKYVADGGGLYAVMERPGMEITTLDAFISGQAQSLIRSNWPWRLRKMIALEVALGIAYAHAAEVLHRGLRSPNIYLTDHNYHPKIYGFFQGRIRTEPSEKRFNSTEQFRWAAPEMLAKNRPAYNDKCDIFSLGVILWELITWSYPYSGLKPLQVMNARTKQGKVLEFHSGGSTPSPSLQDFMQISLDCMEVIPDNRPNIESVVDRISRLAPEDMQV